jgi:hypothetical protein
MVGTQNVTEMRCEPDGPLWVNQVQYRSSVCLTFISPFVTYVAIYDTLHIVTDT